jgi:hypothetical protein
MHKLAVRVKGTDETFILAGTARKLIARLELFKMVHVNELRLRVIADSGLILAKLRHIERGLRGNTRAALFAPAETVSLQPARSSTSIMETTPFTTFSSTALLASCYRKDSVLQVFCEYHETSTSL